MVVKGRYGSMLESLLNVSQGGESYEKRFKEEQLLLALIRADWNDAETVLKRGHLDNQKFHKIVKNAGVGAYIDSLIESDNKQFLLPSALLEVFRNARKKAKIDNAYILGILDRIIHTAESRKIEIILLKGADLVHRVYTSPELRHLDDIDLLIHSSDLDEFMGLLNELDFKVPVGKELDYFRRASYNLECWTKSLFPCLFEVHWDLSQRFRYRVNMDDVWKDSQPCQQFSENVRLLNLEDLFIHLSIHIFHHSFHPQLKWHVDLKELIRRERLDFVRILGRSEEWGCKFSVFYSLLYLKKLFPDLIPQSYFAGVKVPRLRDYFISRYYTINPVKLFDSGGNKFAERVVRTISIDRMSDMMLFSLNRMLRNPWVRFEGDQML